MSKTLDEWWNEAESLKDTDIILYSEEELRNVGIEIECQANGSNNPEDLVDGIFIPYSFFKRR